MARPKERAIPPVLYRIVKRNPPGRDDFVSSSGRGRAVPSDPVLARLWEGISLWDSLGRARQKATDLPRLGRYIAEVRLPTEVRVEKTLGRGHYTAWGEAATLLAAAGTTMPVAEVD